MLEYEDKEVQEIVAFVKSMKDRKGAQYKDVKQHFNWGHDKWIRHWKKAQKYLDKKNPSEIGLSYPRYFVKKPFEEKAKTLLFTEEIVSGLHKGVVQEIEVPSTSIIKAIDEELERLRPMFEEMGRKEEHEAYEKYVLPGEERKNALKRKKGIGSRLKEALGNQSLDRSPEDLKRFIAFAETLSLLEEVREHATKLHKHEARIGFLNAACMSNIHIVYDKTEPLPSIDGNDIANLLQILAKNIHAGIKKPWYLVAAYSIPEEVYAQVEKRNPENDNSV